MNDIVERLRGEHLDCICAAYSSNECCCDTHWPEDSCREAADEIERLRDQLEKSNKYADHLGMSLRDVKKERDELKKALQMVCEIGCVDDLWKAQDAIAKLGADKTGEE